MRNWDRDHTDGRVGRHEEEIIERPECKGRGDREAYRPAGCHAEDADLSVCEGCHRVEGNVDLPVNISRRGPSAVFTDGAKTVSPFWIYLTQSVLLMVASKVGKGHTETLQIGSSPI